MPTYDFKCDKCGKIDEYIVPLTTSVPENCSCEKKCKNLTKMDSFCLNNPVYKVAGFYQTDYVDLNPKPKNTDIFR